MAPFLNPLNAADGLRSIERAFTAMEMRRIVRSTGVPFRHHVAPFNIRQIVDVEYSPAGCPTTHNQCHRPG
jgi:hypothetical protein